MMALLALRPFDTQRAPTTTAASGYCSHCEAVHRLPRTPEAEARAAALIQAIDDAGRFDYDAPHGDARFKTSNVYAARTSAGKMLGVLLCEGGSELRAFSGMLGGTWHCPGWVGPTASVTLEDPAASARFQTIVEHVVASRDTRLAESERETHRNAHRTLSAALSDELAASVVLRSPHRRAVRLPELLSARGSRRSRIPGGVGDCAAPKLLNEAYARGLRPMALAEVWHEAPHRRDEAGGGEDSGLQQRKRRRRRKHGSFHEACAERCGHIMGFMLCGL
jgi:hypothetical protein